MRVSVLCCGAAAFVLIWFLWNLIVYRRAIRQSEEQWREIEADIENMPMDIHGTNGKANVVIKRELS